MPEPGRKRKVKDALFGNTQQTAIGVQQAEMANARLGALYVLAKTELQDAPPEPFSILTKIKEGVFSQMTPINDISTVSGWLINKATDGTTLGSLIHDTGAKAAHYIARMDAAMTRFFQQVLDKMASLFGKYRKKVRGYLETISAKALSGLASGILSTLMPGSKEFKSASNIWHATHKAIEKTIALVSQSLSGYGVELLGGQPSIIANALARHSAAGIASGVKDFAAHTTILGLKIAGDAAGAAGTIVSTIVKVLLAVVNFIDSLVQKYLVKSVLSKARVAWDNRMSDGALVNDHKAFSEWFQDKIIFTPVFAALVMGSGFVGHPYRFLQLLFPGDRLISQAEFDKGVKHIEKLKKLSGKYIREYEKGYQLHFAGTDALVRARLDEMATGCNIALNPVPTMIFERPLRTRKVFSESGEADY